MIGNTKKDEYGNELVNYTKLMPCTPMGQASVRCPEGWESAGTTAPGSCLVANVSGDVCAENPNNYAWNMWGYQRVCKRKVPTSGDAGVDCCSNLFGVADSIECRAKGLVPYGGTCDKIMTDGCNTNVASTTARYGPNWNGMPYGQDGVVRLGCQGLVVEPAPEKKPGCMTEFCVNYMRNAPPNSFFYEHDFSDHPYYYPRYSYTTPDFVNVQGYYPAKPSYKPYNDYKSRVMNNFCYQNPNQCQGREFRTPYFFDRI